ncbi:flagella basal body P-ring formation protein FlgA [Granulicella sp. S190]|uniref:flagella basal body P-ring formation protein FlgA n=1 Tax=Granulicella sp. S190 TaxID=1747226 RepID=UPI00131C870B|nr:flagella basal body P-ring formation protein FlgA [Granulicella sp. S190]
MSTIFSKLKTIASVFVVLNGVGLAHTAFAGCYKTPLEAVAAGTKTSSGSSIPEDGGYRVARVQTDLVLGRSWAMIVACDHPGWPAIAVPQGEVKLTERLEEQKSARSSAVNVLVRAGDVVRLWRQESRLRIEVAGVSEQNGGLGSLVRVRLLRTERDDQGAMGELSGIVRGPSDVEIRP